MPPPCTFTSLERLLAFALGSGGNKRTALVDTFPRSFMSYFVAVGVALLTTWIGFLFVVGGPVLLSDRLVVTLIILFVMTPTIR